MCEKEKTTQNWTLKGFIHYYIEYMDICLFYNNYRNCGRFLSFLFSIFLIHLKFKIFWVARFSPFNCDVCLTRLFFFFQQKHNKTAGCSLVSRNLLSPIQWFLFFQLDVEMFVSPIWADVMLEGISDNSWGVRRGKLFNLFSPSVLEKATFSRYEVSAGLIWSWRSGGNQFDNRCETSCGVNGATVV